MQKYILDQLLRFAKIAKNAKSNAKNQPGVTIQQLAERGLIPCLYASHQRLIVQLPR